jgi:hypothetical protein
MNNEIVYSESIEPDQTIASLAGPGCQTELAFVAEPGQTIEFAEPDQTIDWASGV